MIVKIAWFILAAIHALPALALFRPAMIGTLYHVESNDPLFLLLHHRAALFLVMFMLCIWAVFDPTTRRVASAGVAVSMISFLILYWSTGAPPALKSIAMTDLVCIPILFFVTWKAFAV